MKNAHLPSLTSLRFFAALMVFFSHMDFLRIHTDAAGNADAYQEIYNTWMFEGYSGVTFFFILSGFILAHSYQDRIASKKTSTTDFFIYRIARIVPLHWLTLALAIYLLRSESSNWNFFSLESFWLNFLLLHAWFSNMDIAFSYNLVSWSLSDEMFFYALFPLLIRFGTGTLIATFLLLIAFILAWLPITIPFAPFHLPMYTNLTKYYAYWYPAFRASDFLAGIILYRAWRARKELRPELAGALQGISIITLCMFYSLHASVDDTYRFDFYYAPPMMFVIYTFAFQNGIFSRMLSNRIMVTLGEASFAFYMIHQLAIYHMNYKLVRYNDILTQLFHTQDKAEYAVAIHLLICVTLSILLFFLFERPAQYLFNKILFFLKSIITKPKQLRTT